MTTALACSGFGAIVLALVTLIATHPAAKIFAGFGFITLLVSFFACLLYTSLRGNE